MRKDEEKKAKREKRHHHKHGSASGEAKTPEQPSTTEKAV